MAFQMNPQMRKLHQKPADLNTHMEGTPAVEHEEPTEEKGHIEVHHHPEGGMHTVTHQPHQFTDGVEGEDGSMQHEHENVDAVAEHMKKHFGEESQEVEEGGSEESDGGDDY